MVKHLIIFCFLFASGVYAAPDRIFWGVPPTVVNGLRCYWKYTCFLQGKYSIDAPCEVYVPQKYCEEVKIHVKPDESKNIQVDQLGTVTDKTDEKRETTESSRPKDVTTKLPPPSMVTYGIIDAPVNCAPGELPDSYGECRMSFGRGLRPES